MDPSVNVPKEPASCVRNYSRLFYLMHFPHKSKATQASSIFSGAVDPFNFGIQFQYPTKQQEFYGSTDP